MNVPQLVQPPTGFLSSITVSAATIAPIVGADSMLNGIRAVVSSTPVMVGLALAGVAGIAALATTAYLKSINPVASKTPSSPELKEPLKKAFKTRFAVQQSHIKKSQLRVFESKRSAADAVRAESLENAKLIAENKAAHIAHGKEVIAKLKK